MYCMALFVSFKLDNLAPVLIQDFSVVEKRRARKALKE